jgi:hypothetical protein
MKKKLLLFCMVGFLAIPAFAEHPSNKLGLGLYVGAGYGSVAGGLFNPGLSLKIPNLPIFWGINANLGNSTAGVGISGDYYLLDRTLVKDGSFSLDWFLGLGVFTHIYFGDSSFFALGARVPIGLSWHINKTFELFMDVAPGLGVRFTDSPLYYVGAGELGLRVWL